MMIAHASTSTAFGDLTLFAEDDALVALEWGRAASAPLTPLLRRAIDQLQAYFDGTGRGFDLPLRPAGSAFQRCVWGRLAAIPYAATFTYGELARELGTSPRAVARGCATNPLPIIIPCHRVVGAGGGLGGYSGADGIATKRALLRLEGALPMKGASRGREFDREMPEAGRSPGPFEAPDLFQAAAPSK